MDDKLLLVIFLVGFAELLRFTLINNARIHFAIVLEKNYLWVKYEGHQKSFHVFV